MKIFITSILMILLLTACVSDNEPRSEGISVGARLPQFELTLDNGNAISTDSLLGKVSVIIFFSTSCQDCRRELPRLNEVFNHFQDDGKVIIFAVSREETPQQVIDLWNEFNLKMPFSVQTDRTIYNMFASFGVPRVYISDYEGTIVEAFDESNIPSPSSITSIIEYYCNNIDC